MSKQNVISARVTDEVIAMIDNIAAQRDRSRAWVVANLLEKAAKDEAAFRDFIQVGLDDVAAGRIVSQEQVERWFEARKADRASRIAAE